MKEFVKHAKTLFDNCREVSPNIDSIIDSLPMFEVDYGMSDNIHMTELKYIISLLKCNKATGPDGIPAEIFKYIMNDDILKTILNMFNTFINHRTLPTQIKESTMILIHKKGSTQICNNYRTISLQSTFMKILTKLIIRRIYSHCEKNSKPVFSKQDLSFFYEKWIMPETQSGFRIDRDRSDAIFSLLQIMKDSYQNKVNLIIIFIDLVKAYDYVPRETLWKILKKIGVPGTIIELIKNLHEGSLARIKIEDNLSENFELMSGLKQGCNAAPCLFNIFFGALMWVLVKRIGDIGLKVQVRHKGAVNNIQKCQDIILHMRELLFADDAAFITTTEEDAQALVQIIEVTCRDFGMELSKGKTEILVQKYKDDGKSEAEELFNVNPDIKLSCGTTIKVVKQFKYLGIIISNDNSDKADINRRIANATAAFAENKHVFRNKFKSIRERVMIYDVKVLTILTQCIGVRVLLADSKRRLETFHFRKMREICGWSWADYKSFNEVYSKAKVPSMECILIQKRLTWAAHLYKLPSYRMPRMLAMGRMLWNEKDKKYSYNYNFKSWEKLIQEDLKHFNIQHSDLLKDKKEVKTMLEKCQDDYNIVFRELREEKSKKRKEKISLNLQ